MKTSEKTTKILLELGFENFSPFEVWISVVNKLFNLKMIDLNQYNKFYILYENSKNKGTYDINSNLVLMVNLIYKIVFNNLK